MSNSTNQINNVLLQIEEFLDRYIIIGFTLALTIYQCLVIAFFKVLGYCFGYILKYATLLKNHYIN